MSETVVFDWLARNQSDGSTDASRNFRRCGNCGKPEHGSIACESAPAIKVNPVNGMIIWEYPVHTFEASIYER